MHDLSQDFRTYFKTPGPISRLQDLSQGCIMCLRSLEIVYSYAHACTSVRFHNQLRTAICAEWECICQRVAMIDKEIQSYS